LIRRRLERHNCPDPGGKFLRCFFLGTPTKRQVSKGQVSKRPGLQTSGFKTSGFKTPIEIKASNVRLLNLIYLFLFKTQNSGFSNSCILANIAALLGMQYLTNGFTKGG
jgi:hypothetical protein